MRGYNRPTLQLLQLLRSSLNMAAQRTPWCKWQSLIIPSWSQAPSQTTSRWEAAAGSQTGTSLTLPTSTRAVQSTSTLSSSLTPRTSPLQSSASVTGWLSPPTIRITSSTRLWCPRCRTMSNTGSHMPSDCSSTISETFTSHFTAWAELMVAIPLVTEAETLSKFPITTTPLIFTLFGTQSSMSSTPMTNS